LIHRFFVASNCINPPFVRLEDQVAYQIKTVLRLQPGDEIIVLDNSGVEWQVRLTEMGKKSVQGQIEAQRRAQGEPRVHLNLYQGVLKGQKFEWVLQKGTELGISTFTPTLCQRSIVRDLDTLTKKETRWRQIIREAAEQSGRGKLPQLDQAQPFEAAIRQVQPGTLMIMPWEEAGGEPFKQVLSQVKTSTIALFIGPEGGFTAAEAMLAREAGARVVTLGPRILRAETAGLAACAAILYELDEWC
jgi:16S rRNA (uracil1498-N3)-methyltransferase